MNKIKQRNLLALMVAFLLLGYSTRAISAPVNFTSPLGMNTNEALENDSSLPFVDLFRLALPFEEARPWFTKGKVTFDRDGWPTNLSRGRAGTRFISHMPIKNLPQGLYTVRYDGEGRIRYGASAKLVKRLYGKDIIRFVPMKDNLITATLFIENTNPKNYIRNIRVLMPGGVCMGDAFHRVNGAKACGSRQFLSFEDHYQQIIFNPEYLNFMKDFKVIRFMNMGAVTRNNLKSWKKRPHLTKATWGGKEGVRGIPIEIMVELANQLNIDPWFNIPHNADDGFLHSFSQYVRDHLRPHLKVYIEYSNETWNGLFVSQAEHMKQQGTRFKLDKNRRYAGAKYYSMQSVKIFKLWERVFGGQQRLVRVMGGMTTDTKLTHLLLGYKNAYRYVDAFAIGPYFHIPQKEIRKIRSVNAIFKKLSDPKNRYSVKNILKFVHQQANITRRYGVDLVAYEGGQHLVDHKTHSLSEGATPYLLKANRDPRMGRLYFELLNGWKDAGGKLFVLFSAPRSYTWHGSWGVKEYIAQVPSLAPKYQAILSFNRTTPCWWEGCTSSVTFHQRKPRSISKHRVLGVEAVAEKPLVAPVFKLQRAGYKWLNAPSIRIGNLISGDVDNRNDLLADWRATWDNEGLNIRVNVQDDKIVQDSSERWADDSIEIYLDIDNSRQPRYDGRNDFKLSYRLRDNSVTLDGVKSKLIQRSIGFSMKQIARGYVLETSIPWKALRVNPKVNQRIGFEVEVNDDDSGKQRDGKIAWNAKVDKAWKNPQMFGQIILQQRGK
ncbi:MAG: CBM9 family sugar-binding protein [Cocleimonas sp.]|nr:CBM9 family sugar-binding protein [Cocleimonas sp.]